MTDPSCTHEWRTCPIHGREDGTLPPFRVGLTCVYGGTETKDGTPWDQSDSDEVVACITARFGPEGDG